MAETISQALRRIKKIKGQIGEHRANAGNSVTHLAEQQPAYQFGASTEKASVLVDEMLRLQTAVAIANATTSIEVDGKKIVLALAVRTLRELTSEIAWTKGLAVKAQEKVVEHEMEFDGTRHVNAPKTYLCLLPEAKRAARVTELQDRFDRLNDIVETANHKTLIG